MNSPQLPRDDLAFAAPVRKRDLAAIGAANGKSATRADVMTVTIFVADIVCLCELLKIRNRAVRNRLAVAGS